MQITKEQADKVIAALELIFGEGNSFKEIAEAHKEALTIMRGLAEGEPVAWLYQERAAEIGAAP